jgi:hypothetical protein
MVVVSITSGVVHSADVDDDVQSVHLRGKLPHRSVSCTRFDQIYRTVVLTDFRVTSPDQIGILILHSLPQHGNAEGFIRMECARVRSNDLFVQSKDGR